MKKVTVVGAGHVGATVADAIAHKDIVNEVVLLDIYGDMAKGKALDIWEQAPIGYYSTRLKGTDDYKDTADSDVVVITAGIPRKPGMSRDDLISTNAKIVKTVTESLLKYSKDPIIIIVSNPLDVMTYAAHTASGMNRNKVFGMAGVLDTARFRAFIAEELNVSPKDIQALLMGGHGDTMVPLPRYTTIAGIPLRDMMDEETITRLVERTKKGGGELVKLMGTSAWYAPGSAAAQMVESIIKDDGRIFPCCVKLEGEYDQHDVYLGVPVQLGKEGIKKLIEINLNDEEKELLETSSNHVKAVMKVYDDLQK
ncbi:MAG TPA: malate dehydrogenase [Bacteroidetes bacterium]|nr:malate dehydrogenase [Bacteroidota bacterium]